MLDRIGPSGNPRASGIGRADQRAEHQAPGEGEAEPGHIGDKVASRPDKECRKQDAERAQDQDRPATLAHLGPVDVQRSCEKQEGEHSLHQRRVEIDPAQESHHVGADTACREQCIDRDDGQRGQQPHEGVADRRRKTQEAPVQVAERGGENDQHGRCIEW